MNRPQAAIILGSGNQERIYPAPVRAQLETVCHVVVKDCTPSDIEAGRADLATVEVLFSGWGAPRLDERVLQLLPALRAVFYGAGTVRGLVTDAVWDRGIRVFSAWGSNAVPVAEFSFAQILLASHGILPCYRRSGWKVPAATGGTGAYGTPVGLVSLGQIGRRVARFLQGTDLKVSAYDPFVDAAWGQEHGLELVDLPTLFARCQIVSIHTPWLAETEGLVTGELIASMPTGATLINTSRGAVIREAEMIEVLRARPDLTAVLDVTYPEPPAPSSPLFELQNVFLTPHIAGSIGNECARMGRQMVDECARILAGKPATCEVTQDSLRLLA